MNLLMHERISAKALEHLDSAGISFSAEFMETLRIASNYPDVFGLADLVPSPKHAKIDPQWRDYMMIPCNDGEVCFGAWFDSLRLRETVPAVVRFWLEKSFQELKMKNESRAAKYIGCLSHLIGDVGQAAHLMDERILRDLFPQKNACYMTHRMLESISAELSNVPYTPRFLGKSAVEVEWRLLEELAVLNKREKAELPVLFDAVEKRDLKTMQSSAARTGSHCAGLLADLLFTMIQVINGNIAEKIKIHMEELVPVDMFCDPCFNYGIMINQIPGSNIYLPVKLSLGQGPEPGIGMLVRLTPGITCEREAYAEYSIPQGVFDGFSATVGLCRNIPNHGGAVFQIWTDGTLISETPVLREDSEPFRISVPLGTSRKLLLRVLDARGKNQPSAEFFYPVWLNPILE